MIILLNRHHGNRLATLLFVVLLIAPTTCANGKSKQHTYYVHPQGNNTLCPAHRDTECHPLSYYTQEVPKFFASNTNLIFLRGDHVLNIRGTVNITNVTKFTMTGNGSVTKSSDHQIPQPSSNVICNTSTGFYFLFSREIALQRLGFINCGANLTLPDNFSVYAAVTFFQSSKVTLTEVIINGSTGFGLHADQNIGKFLVSNSAFLRSTSTHPTFYGGNARFSYSYPLKIKEAPQHLSNTTLVINSSWFMYGSDNYTNQNRKPANASGLVILIYHPSIHVQIDNITATHNRGYNGGNVAISMTGFLENTSTIDIKNSCIGFGSGHRGGGLRFWYSRSHYGEHSFSPIVASSSKRPHAIVNIFNTHFYNNYANSTGGAIYISHYEHIHIDFIDRKVALWNCTFTHNYITGNDRSHSGAAIEIIKHKIADKTPHNTPQFTLSLYNCNFTSNYLDEAKTEGGIVDIVSSNAVYITNCQFINNTGSSIYVRDGSIIFKGNILFKNNHATFGGALKFCDSSMMYMNMNNTTIVTFEDNSASIVGGAIYVSQEQCKETVPPCFFQPMVPQNTPPSNLKQYIQLNFINNSANKSGDALYGGSVDYCYLVYDFPTKHIKHSTSGQIFTEIFNLKQQSGHSKVSSDPYGVCFCNNTTAEIQTECEVHEHNVIHVYPGQIFNMSVTAVGQRQGIVPGVHIEARLINNTLQDSELIPHYAYNYDRWYLKSCRIVQYILFTNKSEETIILRVMKDNPADGRYYQFKDPEITIVVAPCPWGFKLTEHPPYKCDCDPLLSKEDIYCDINTRMIHRPQGHKWIGCENEHLNSSSDTTNSSECTQLTLARSCPVGFCKNAARNISLETINEQCEGNREGRLCGACTKGYSLGIGSTNCLNTCSTYYLYIMIGVFLVAGILLILLLTICNLTVTEGTINGLLFYANVVHQYKHIFLTDYPNNYNLFRVFIAWINLDFGLNVCFYSHMTMYEKTWLQFGFLFYIWVLELIIIALSHRFIFFTRLVGRNVVKALATLLLISFPKLLNTAINSLKYAHIFKSNGEIQMVWSPDGNVDYLNGKHTPLFVVGVLLCIFALLYTLTLLLIQCLQRRSQLWCLQWVEKLRPFFESYTGLFRDNYRFWPGFLLSCRATLYSLSATFDNYYRIELYLIIGVCVVILIFASVSPHGMYKKWTLNILELTFILKLGILSGAVLAFTNWSPHGHIYYITFPSVSIAVTIFAAIIIFHAYKLVRHSLLFRRMSVWYIRRQHNVIHPTQHFNIQGESSVESAEEATPILRQHLPPVLRFDQYRESLLED